MTELFLVALLWAHSLQNPTTSQHYQEYLEDDGCEFIYCCDEFEVDPFQEYDDIQFKIESQTKSIRSLPRWV